MPCCELLFCTPSFSQKKAASWADRARVAIPPTPRCSIKRLLEFSDFFFVPLISSRSCSPAKTRKAPASCSQYPATRRLVLVYWICTGISVLRVQTFSKNNRGFFEHKALLSSNANTSLSSRSWNFLPTTVAAVPKVSFSQPLTTCTLHVTMAHKSRD